MNASQIWACQQADVEAYARRPAAAPAGIETDRQGRVAVLPVVGTLTKTGDRGTASMSELAAEMRAAANNPAVAAIVLAVDSPGGSVPGVVEMADAVAAAATKKPVEAVVEDLGASAAYWAASQAQKVWVNATGLVGSIGVYAVLLDASGLADSLGVKVHVLRTGPYKGIGVPGAPVSEGELAEMQRVVDGINGHFLTAVSRGRRLPMAKVRELADGRVHVGQQAVALGLADGVATRAEVVARLQSSARGTTADATTGTGKLQAAVAAKVGPWCNRQEAFRRVAHEQPELVAEARQQIARQHVGRRF